jgi:hypothetical protein
MPASPRVNLAIIDRQSASSVLPATVHSPQLTSPPTNHRQSDGRRRGPAYAQDWAPVTYRDLRGFAHSRRWSPPARDCFARCGVLELTTELAT